MLKEDCKLAQHILSGAKTNIKDFTFFHEYSPVYVKSNERIEEYIDYLKNKRNVLSVIGSSDQILNMILHGTTSIDAFDISTLPKYYMYLKIAGIENLSLEEYLSFFYELDKTPEDYDNMYFYQISKTLEKESKEFFDSIINFYDWNEIIDSSLFSNEFTSLSDVKRQNDYLNEENYKKLKELLSNVNISTHEGNILDIYKSFIGPYDLIYLSNIIYYVNRKRYKEMLEQLPLEKDGIIINYLYDSKKQITSFFNEDDYTTHDIPDSDAFLLIKR